MLTERLPFINLLYFTVFVCVCNHKCVQAVPFLCCVFITYQVAFYCHYFHFSSFGFGQNGHEE